MNLYNQIRSATSARTLAILSALLLGASCAATSTRPAREPSMPQVPRTVLFMEPRGAELSIDGVIVGTIPCRAEIMTYNVTRCDMTLRPEVLEREGASSEQIATILELGHTTLAGQICVTPGMQQAAFNIAAEDLLWSLVHGGDITVGSEDGSMRFKGSPLGVSSADAFVRGPIEKVISQDEQSASNARQNFAFIGIMGLALLLPLALI